jgi:hypothetical protein
VRLTRCEVRNHINYQPSLALVSILQSLALAEISNTLHLRDFRSPAIFEFFNTIRQKQSFPSRRLLTISGFVGPRPVNVLVS